LKDVGKIVFILAAVALLPYLQNNAQAQYKQPVVGPTTPLSGVRYDNRWEIYGGVAYSRFTAGPQLVQGSNLGGFDVMGTRWFTTRLGLAGDVRGYYGAQTIT